MYAVVLAGGGGTRLWPLSTPERPKPFPRLLGDESLKKAPVAILGRGAKVGGGAGVASDLAAGSSVNGYPAIPLMLERRIAVLKQRLPELFRRVDAIETQIRGAPERGRPGAA